MTGMGAGMLASPIPIFGKRILPEQLLNPGLDVAQKKALADVALNTAKSLGATMQMQELADTSINLFLPERIKCKILSTPNLLVLESG